MALTEAEIQTVWQNFIDLIEQGRVYVDDTVAGTGNLLDAIETAVEGEYIPLGLTGIAKAYRSIASALVNPVMVGDGLIPILQDYMAFISGAPGSGDGFGTGYDDLPGIWRALYDHMDSNSLTVASRNITFNAESGGTNVGTGIMTRLTVDEKGYDTEACHVEKKIFKCRADQNSGVSEHAETFEMLGEVAGQDDLDRSSFGSGVFQQTFIASRHAGSGAGGSLLRNSTFSTYDANATNVFAGWEKVSGTEATQDTGDFFRSHPGASTTTPGASMKMGASARYKQTIANMRVSSLDPDTPYYARLMWNRTEGTASGGTIKLHLGNQTVTTAAVDVQSGWQTLIIPADANTWFRNFNEDGFDFEVEWNSGSSGYILIDDVVFTPYDLIDGTYWSLVGGQTPWKLDDTLIFTDTGGAPPTAKIQWYNFIGGFGYLPSTTGTETFPDP